MTSTPPVATSRMANPLKRPAVLERVPTSLLAGTWRPASDGADFPVHNPATGQVLARVADGSTEDGLAALDAAVTAGPQWAATAPRARADVLHRAYELLTLATEDLAMLISLELGKPLTEARGEVAYGADFVRWYAEEAVRLNGRHSTTPDGRTRMVTGSRPVGPCLLITPWNFPLAMATRKIAPALAAGCTVVLKPAELTPLTSLLLADLLLQAGVPQGVVNVVTTTDAPGLSRALMADPRLRKLSFTGSTPVGRLLLAQSAEQVLRTSLELGGNAPLLVLDDADLDRAVQGAVLAKLRNGGQSCVAANRLLVQDSIADVFVERFSAAMAAVQTGSPLEPGVTLGPLVDERAVSKCDALVQDAVSRGAQVVTGGMVPDGIGSFYPATVLDHVPDNSRIMAEEVFGPVAPVRRFRHQDEAVELANATPFGLAAYVFSQDVDRALGVAERLETGMVGINQGVVSDVAAPFGGVKQSGLGREGGPEGIQEYLETQYLALSGHRALLESGADLVWHNGTAAAFPHVSAG